MPDPPSPPDISCSMTSPTAPPTALPQAAKRSSPSPSDSPSPPASTLASSSAPSQLNGGPHRMGPTSSSCGGRQLSKVKRFLTTLQQFGSDISPEAGDRVRQLIFNLVNGTLSIDDFHHKLQDTTNFPLRPFVIPFLKANLPLLQREIVHCARAAKLSPQQYLHHHEHLLLEGAHSPPEPDLLFHHAHPSTASSALANEINENGKRRADSSRHKDNGHLEEGAGGVSGLAPPPKRHHHALLSPPHPHPHRLLMDDFRGFERDFRSPYGFGPRDVLMDERENDEEWKSIHTMLNCILGMVEKTKRALAILQHRSQSDRQELSLWVRGGGDKKTEHVLLKEAAGGRGEDKRKAVLSGIVEEAVAEVKRQAVAELHKAVSSAELKAREMVAGERAKMDKMLMEARVQAAEDALHQLNQQADSSEACWNCGRKASETCSGCNNARYCGSFCQHKDWENHHLVCGQGAPAQGTQTQGAQGSQGPTGRTNAANKSAQITSSAPTSASATSTSGSSNATSASKTIANDVLH